MNHKDPPSTEDFAFRPSFQLEQTLNGSIVPDAIFFFLAWSLDFILLQRQIK